MAQTTFRKTALAVALSLATAAAFAQSSAGTQPSNTGNASTTAQPPLTNAGGANAHSKGPAFKGGKPGALAHGDRKFVEEAAEGGLLEVELGNYAASHASSDSVKQFGKRMATDHAKANDELKALASSKGVEVPGALDKKHGKDVAKFEKMDAAKFDREYMQHMVKDHKKDVKEFEKQARHAKDPDLKAFAEKTLPTLQEHLKLAQSTYDTVKSGPHGGSMSSSNPGGGTGVTASNNSTKSDKSPK